MVLLISRFGSYTIVQPTNAVEGYTTCSQIPRSPNKYTLTVLFSSVAFDGICLMLFICDILVPCYIDPKAHQRPTGVW